MVAQAASVGLSADQMRSRVPVAHERVVENQPFLTVPGGETAKILASNTTRRHCKQTASLPPYLGFVAGAMLSCMQYAVKDGDCILSISKDFGFFWQTIWNDSRNASLKALRKDPNVLLAGDSVYIPDKQIKQVACPTDALHKFVRKGVPAMLRLQLLDRQHQPRTGLNYVLNIDGALVSEPRTATATWSTPCRPTRKKPY